MTKIRKSLTHNFESTDNNIHDFDSFIKNYIKLWEYNNKATFKKKSVTNLEINVVNNENGKMLYPEILCLKGISLGNQILNIISYEVVDVPISESEPKHQHYKLQIYNDSEVDIVTDVKVQLGVCYYEL